MFVYNQFKNIYFLKKIYIAFYRKNAKSSIITKKNNI